VSWERRPGVRLRQHGAAGACWCCQCGAMADRPFAQGAGERRAPELLRSCRRRA